MMLYKLLPYTIFIDPIESGFTVQPILDAIKLKLWAEGLNNGVISVASTLTDISSSWGIVNFFKGATIVLAFSSLVKVPSVVSSIRKTIPQYAFLLASANPCNCRLNIFPLSLETTPLRRQIIPVSFKSLTQSSHLASLSLGIGSS